MTNRFLLLVVACVAVCAVPLDARAAPADTMEHSGPPWAVGMLVRTATIPFDTDANTVSTLVPLIFYEGETFYFTGLSGGFKIYETPSWQLGALARLRFFDIPAEFQNRIQGDQAVWGGQARYKPYDPYYLEFEILSDGHRNPLGNVRAGALLNRPDWSLNAFVELQTKSRGFNSRYYGLDSVSVAGGSEFSVGAIGTYRVWSNFFLFGAGEVSRLDRGVRDVPFVRRKFNTQVFAGIGLGEYGSEVGGPLFTPGSYVRLAHGWFTPSALSEVIRGQAKKDEFNNQMTSLFYGHPLSNTLLTLPIDVYLHSGFVQHWKSEVQSTSQEFVVSIKIYYTIPTPWRIRVGAAEGLSWINSITYVERTQLGKKDFEPSNLLNYLGFSADINIGDIVRNEEAKSWALGYSIHHRSAIYELAQQFGRIRGGSNIQSVYLQKSF